MLLKRIIVAVIFIPILIFFILWGGFAFLGLVCAIIGCGLFEFYRGMKIRGLSANIGILLGVGIPISFYLMGKEAFPSVLTLAIFLLFLGQFFEFEPRRSSTNTFINIGGILYISFLFSYILLLRKLSGIGTALTITVFFATWMGDTGAYFIGEKWGKHKLLPEISPHKSKEGFVGAILISLSAIFISRLWFPLPLIHTLIMGVLIGIMGQMGDFFESIIKRQVGIKDFGRLLPGHGGVLDRFDSLLFTVPLFYYYVKYLIIS
jgi:phosphatidate cytidylyltransferase